MIRALRRALLALSLAAALPAAAHKASDAYLQIDARADATTLRWDIALRDLDVALDLDADEDGRLVWSEVRAAWPRIEAYALSRLSIDGCALTPLSRALERRGDGAYAALTLDAGCVLPAAPVIRYALFADVDPTHRVIARTTRAGGGTDVEMLKPDGITAASTTPIARGDAPARANPTAIAGAPSSGATPRGITGFLAEGVHHILTGYDHVLFLICLLLPAVMRRAPDGRWRPVRTPAEALWPVIGLVSAFTVAHSTTLGLAATKRVSLPPAWIEPAIAATIVLAALDNLRPIFPARRAVIAFVFGLVHGFGFAGVLGELDLPTGDFARALLGFNVGLELGQVAIVVVATAALYLLRERRRYETWVLRAGSGLALVVGVLWFVERTANVSLMPF